MAWSVVSSASYGNNVPALVVPSAGSISTVGANVIVALISIYTYVPAAGDLVDSASNSWAFRGEQNAAGDSAMRVAIFDCITPTTSGTHTFTFDHGGNSNQFHAMVVYAFTQSATTSFGSYVENGTVTGGTDINAGSIGSANQLVVEAIAYYTNTGMAIGASFATPVEVGYTGSNIGVAASWKEVSGAVDPHWTWTGSNVAAAAATSYAGSGGGGGGGKPFKFYQNMQLANYRREQRQREHLIARASHDTMLRRAA
jgi:hypothetical protein